MTTSWEQEEKNELLEAIRETLVDLQGLENPEWWAKDAIARLEGVLAKHERLANSQARDPAHRSRAQA